MRALKTALCLDPESSTAAETLSRSTVSISLSVIDALKSSHIKCHCVLYLTLTDLTDTYTCHQSGEWVSEDGTPLPKCLPGKVCYQESLILKSLICLYSVLFNYFIINKASLQFWHGNSLLTYVTRVGLYVTVVCVFLVGDFESTNSESQLPTPLAGTPLGKTQTSNVMLWNC